MTPERWQKVEGVFHEALERPPGERTAWITNACGGDEELRREVSSLLASDVAGAGSFLHSKVQRAVLTFHEGGGQYGAGRRIGPYELVREIGRGGMGAVWLAVRADDQYVTEVAIKLVRQGLDTDLILRRFRRERQILAWLQHPNIARLLDGGTTEDGTPYLVMEFVQGSWITRHAAEHRLTVDQKLRLFLSVCDAVAHAHRNFIVHRDLKPGNILIDQGGAPKLLDFGISKFLYSEQADATITQDGSMMTPDYASPEQILGEPITIATDTYSLGAVLYELLTGHLPHRIEKCTPLALERAICLDQTIMPSVVVRQDHALSRRLKGDLDNIILRAMQKDPVRRYASVEDFAQDIRRHLSYLPVVARPDTLLYRARKFLRRNRVAVAGVAFAAAFLGAGVIVSSYQAHIARQRFEQVRRLANTFVFDVEASVRNLPGATSARRLIATTGLEYLDNLARSAARDWPLQRELAEAYQRIGDVQGGSDTANLGDSTAALASYVKADKLLGAVLEHNPGDRQAALDRLALRCSMGSLESYTGKLHQAIETFQNGLHLAEAKLAHNPGDLDFQRRAADLYRDLSRVQRDADNIPGAVDSATRSVGLLDRIVAAHPGERVDLYKLSSAYEELGGALAGMGRRDAALQKYRRKVAIMEDLCRIEPVNTQYRRGLMLAYSHIGDTLGNPNLDSFGDAAGAMDAYSKMVVAAKLLYDADPDDLRAVTDYAISLMRIANATPARQASEKLDRFRQSRDLFERVATASPSNATNAINKSFVEAQMGDLLLAQGNHEGAVRSYEQATATSEALLVADPVQAPPQRLLVMVERKLADEHARSGRRERALAVVDKMLHLAEDSLKTAGAAHLSVLVPRAYAAAGSVHAILAQAFAAPTGQRRRDREDARNWYQRAVSAWQQLSRQPEFSTFNRKEMEAAVAALASASQVRP
jgi:tetratricopeptide (TPR) repeat protein